MNVFILKVVQSGVSRFSVNLCMIQPISQSVAAFNQKSQQVPQHDHAKRAQ